MAKIPRINRIILTLKVLRYSAEHYIDESDDTHTIYQIGSEMIEDWSCEHLPGERNKPDRIFFYGGYGIYPPYNWFYNIYTKVYTK